MQALFWEVLIIVHKKNTLSCFETTLEIFIFSFHSVQRERAKILTQTWAN